MNWGIKDENVKNLLWTERCRKDVRAARGMLHQSHWNAQPESLERHILSRDINDRERRFLNQGPSLLASLSRYVSRDNVTPQAEFVRSFRAMRREKSSRPPLRSFGLLAVVPLHEDSVIRPTTTDEFPMRPESGGIPPRESAATPAVAQVPRPGTAALVRPTTAVSAVAQPGLASSGPSEVLPLPSGGNFRRPLSAMQFRNHNRPPKWEHPVATSDVYGWKPSCVPASWEDSRFKHPLSSTDVTRDGLAGLKSRK